MTESYDPTELAQRGFGLQHDSFGRLVLIDAEGRRHVGVEPIRSFPLADSESWVTLCDREGREILCIESLSTLASAQRQMILDELARREFVPVIRRIVSVSSTAEPSEWTVETDRGTTTFFLNGEEDVRGMGGNRVTIIDDQGIRYSIADHKQLDSTGRKILDRYL